MTFQDKAKQAAEEHNFYDDPGKKLGFRHGFIAGSAWGHEQGFQEAVEMLSGDRAVAYDYGYFVKLERSLTPSEWADWLQEQRKRGDG